MMNFNHISILVTAVGGELAFSILKAVNKMLSKPKVIGCDIYSDVVGKYWVDEFTNVPACSNERLYIEKIEEIIVKYGIRVIIPTNDYEIILLSRHKENIKNKYKCEIFVNNFAVLEIYNDKWSAYQWFVENDVGTPYTSLDFQSVNKNQNFPLLIKPRRGGGSRFISVVKNIKELHAHLAIVPDPIVQEYVGVIDEEYTAGTYRAKTGEIFTIILKRTLKFGMTNTAEVVFSKELTDYCVALIQKSDLIGANNIQFRLDGDVPKVLEVNPRFSGTTGIRANFGFNEIELWLSDCFYNEVKEPFVKSGKVLRYMEEIYVNE